MGWRDAPAVNAGGAWQSAPAVDMRAVKTTDEPLVNTEALGDTLKDTGKNIALGALSGAANIGATLLAPIDYLSDKITGKTKPTMSALVTGAQPKSSNQERREALSNFFRENADPNANAFKLGETGAEIAGTAGAGGAIANVGRALGVSAPLAAAIESGGFRLGVPAAQTVGGKLLQLGTRAAGGAISGGAMAGLVKPENAGTGALIGGALPPAVQLAGAAGRGVRNLVTNEVAPEVKALYEKAKNYGINIPADRIVNSKPLNAAAASLEYVPFSGRTGTMNKIDDQFNAALSRTIGENTPNMTQAMRNAETKLGAKFDATLKGNGVVYDQQFVDSMVRDLEAARTELGAQSDGFKKLTNITNHIFDIAKQDPTGGLAIKGEAAYNVKKILDRLGNSADSSLAYHARELKGSLMDALDRSLGPTGAADFAKLRQQYGNMLTLQNLVPAGAEGSVSAARLANTKGLRGELKDLADIAGQFLKARENPHGAAQRVFLSAAAPFMKAGAGGAALGFAGGVPALVAGSAIGRGTNAALNSPAVKDYLLRSAAAPNYQLLANPANRATVYSLLNQASRAGQQ